MINPNTLPKINALDWQRKHTGHRKTQGEGLGAHNGQDIILLISTCHDCLECYIYDWVFQEGVIK